jgi:hypothetical protein
VPGPGAAAAAQAIFAHFKQSNSPLRIGSVRNSSESDQRIIVTGSEGWTLDIKGDGTSVRMANTDYLFASPRVSRDNKPTAESLEALGRAFIASELKDFVRLSSADTLVALRTLYQVESDQQIGKAEVHQEVTAATIMFGRKVDGVSVVGAGSKVSVTFANDGMPVAFSYDWPEYRANGRVQKVLPIEAIRERSSACASRRPTSASVELRRFECGYVDVGARLSRRDPSAPIQSGCFAHYVGTQAAPDATGKPSADPKSPVEDVATAEPIPIGEDVEVDRGWPHAAALAAHGDVCAVSQLSSAIVPGSAAAAR